MPIDKEENPNQKQIKVNSKQDLHIEVNRPPEATLKVPELGVEITPGPAKTEPITDVLDIITRIETVLNTYVEESKKKKNLLEAIHKIKSGNKEITLIIEKPTKTE